MDKGATFVGMAFVAELIGAFGIEQVLCLGAMGVVAIGALDLAFDDWVMRPLVDVGTDIFMTIEAHCGLSYGGAGRMNVMAGNTGYVVLLVRTHIPQSKVG